MTTIPGPGLVTVRWSKRRALSKLIYEHGKPQCSCTEGNLLVIGTVGAEVLVFKSDSLVANLKLPTRKGGYGAVTHVYKNQERIVAGFALGFVAVWTHNSLDFISSPVSTPPRANSIENDKEGHLIGTPITGACSFGDTVITCDARGLVIQHHQVRLLMERKIRCKRLLGEYSPTVPTCVLSLKLIGSLLCVLTAQHFVVYSLASSSFYPEGVQFVLPARNSTTILSGDLDTVPLEAAPAAAPLVALAWSDSLQILKLEWLRNHRASRPTLQCTAERAYTHDQSLVRVQFWGSYILLLDVSQQLLVLDADTLQVVHRGDLHSTHLMHTDLYSGCLKETVADSYAGSLFVMPASSTMLLVGQYELHLGSFVNWADQIMSSLNNSNPIDAIKLAINCYKTSTNLELIGLTNDRDPVAASMPDIILTLVRYTLEMDRVHVSEILDACLEAIMITDIPLLEQVYDLVEPSDDDEVVLLHKILLLIKQGTIKVLEPKIYKRLIQFLGQQNLSKDLAETLLLLDPQTLDINLAVQLCKQHDLHDTQIYLSVSALGDFVTPLQIPGPQRYKFLKQSLCGQVYLSGAPMSPEQHTRASHDIYSHLFGENHALLTDMLTSDPDAMFEALDSAFEQPYLNEENDEHLNRQYITSVLKLVCQDSKQLKLPFSIFVARNAAKYPQFLVLRGSQLENTLNELCVEGPQHDEREMATLSLLSVFKSHHFSETIALLNEAKFYTVMEQLYLQKGDYKSLAKTLITHVKQNYFKEFWHEIKLCLDHDSSLTGLVLEETRVLAASSPAEFAKLVEKYGLPLSEQLDSIPEQARLEVLNNLERIPAPAIVVAHILLLAKYDGVKLIKILTSVYRDNVQLSQVVDGLIEHERTDALVLLLSRLGRDSEAMIYLIDHIESNPDDVDRYVTLGIELCARVSKRDVSEGGQVWKKLLMVLDRMGIDTHSTISELVRCNISTSEQQEQAPPDDTSSSLCAIVASGMNTKMLHEYYTTIEQQKMLIKVIRQIFEGMSYGDIMQLVRSRLQGWTLSIDGECEGCGEKVCGLGIDASKVYREWERRISNEKEKERAMNISQKSNTLVVFRCTHVYHTRCLFRFEKDYQCTLCTTSL